MTEKKKNKLLIFVSVLFSLGLIEIFYTIQISFKTTGNSLEPGYLIYEQGKVFRNTERIVKYEPKKNILTKAFFFTKNQFKEAYSYEIKTNNFGLVQSNDLIKKKPSILFLGDSFTEGQGEEAWINKFGGNYNEFQIINGGILATGPQQFELMEKHVSNSFNIKKVVLLYIGHDIRRDPYNLSDQELACLKSYQNCNGKEIFFGFPIREQNPNFFLNQLRNKRIENHKELPLTTKLKNNVKNFFSNLYVIKIPLNFLREKFYKSKNIKIKKNIDALKSLHDKYGDDIIFIHLTTRNEILNGREYESSFAINNILKFSNNHYFCDFENNLRYYNNFDNHPNKVGYNYLFNCVKQIMEDKIN